MYVFPLIVLYLLEERKVWRYFVSLNFLKAYTTGCQNWIFLYIKSCQYSMFYTNCNWNFSQYHTSLFYFLESSKESNVYPRNIHTTWQWTRSGKCLRMCEIVDEESAWHKSNRGKMKTLTDSIWKRHKKEDSASFV